MSASPTRRILGVVLIVVGAILIVGCGLLGLWISELYSVGMNERTRQLLIAAAIAGPVLMYLGIRSARARRD